MKFLVIGRSGFLGGRLCELLPSATGMDRRLIDLSQPIFPMFRNFLMDGNFTHVLICAAISDVGECFREPESTRQVNVTGTLALCDLIRSSGAVPVFFSSDYVFGNEGAPFAEGSPRNPLTVYGRQKLEAEVYLEKNFSNFLVFRTSKLMSKTLHPRSILTPVIENLAAGKVSHCFSDQWLNPVFVEDIAQAIVRAAERDLRGFYHLGTRKVLTRFEIGKFLAEVLGRNPALIQPSKVADLTFAEKRPQHHTLVCAKAERDMGLRFTELEDAVPELRQLVD